MAKYFIEDTTLTNIADAIRSYTGSTDVIKVSDIAFEIESIGSEITPVLQEKSVTPSESVQTVMPDDGYDALSSVTVDAISQTYVGSGVDRVEATTIVPTTTSQIAVHAGSYVTGDIEVAAVEVENLDVEISEQDSLIEQIQTALEGKVAPSGGIDTSDATATEVDIASGKTAYVNGNKITGTHTCSTGGGASLQTCNLHIINDSPNSCHVYATLLNSETSSPETLEYEEIPANTSKTISNVLCNSIIGFMYKASTGCFVHEDSFTIRNASNPYVTFTLSEDFELRYGTLL